MFQLRNIRTHQVHALSIGRNHIGRHPKATISLDVSSVSRLHAELIVQLKDTRHSLTNPYEIFVKDLQSGNGTFLNGDRLSEEAEMVIGDCLNIADQSFCLENLTQLASNEETIMGFTVTEFDD